MSIHHQRGGYARAAALTPERRAEIARMGGRARAARALMAWVVHRILSDLDAAREADGVRCCSILFGAIGKPELFTARSPRESHALRAGAIALAAFRAAGYDAVVSFFPGEINECLVSLRAPAVITEEVHDDPA